MIAQDLSKLKSDGSHAPIVKKPLNLTIEDITRSEPTINWWELRGRVNVNFLVDENGKVVNPNIIDTFDIRLNEVIIDKLKLIEYSRTERKTYSSIHEFTYIIQLRIKRIGKGERLFTLVFSTFKKILGGKIRVSLFIIDTRTNLVSIY